MNDIHWAQKLTKKRNREKILSAILKEPMTFMELKKELKLSKPILSTHLHFLRQQKLVTLDLENDRRVYKLTSEASELPILHAQIFENESYLCIIEELIKEKEAYTQKKKTTFQSKNRMRGWYYREIDPKIVAEKSDDDFIQAIDKWFTPIVIYAILQELKTKNDWTQTVHGLSQRLKEIIKLKNLSNFEEALRKHYSERLIQSIFYEPSSPKTPIFQSLDLILWQIGIHKFLDSTENLNGVEQ